MSVAPNAVARVVGIDTQFTDLSGGRVVNLPQRIAVVAQGSSAITYSTTKKQITSAFEAGEIYGFGSPIHLMALSLLPPNGDGVGTIPVTIYPLVDDGSAAPSVGNILPAGTVTKAGAFQVNINEIFSAAFVVEIGDTLAQIVTKIFDAVSAEVNMPMTPTDNATDLDLTSKWEGTSANQLTIVVEGPSDTGITFGITAPVGGLVNPDVDPALAQFGGVWESLVLNAMEDTDETTLEKFAVHGEGRWGSVVRRPYAALTGSVEDDVDTISAIPETRKTDRVNGYEPAPSSPNLPFVIASRAMARLAVRANTNPPTDYGSQRLTGLTPGPDEDQWTATERELLVVRGVSTTQVKDNVVNMSDTVTFYHPTGDVIPAYRFIVDIIKLQNIIFNLDLIFMTPEWDGAPLIPDNQATTNELAKKPRMAVAAVNTLIDQLALAAIISDPETAKASTVAQISETNPKRLDLETTMQISGNSNIIDFKFKWGFFFGTNIVVAT